MRLPSSRECQPCDNFPVCSGRKMSKISIGHFVLAAAVSLCQLSVPAFCAGPGQNVPMHLGVSSSWTGDTSSHSTADNSGRQMAVAFPLIPHTMSVRSPLESRVIGKTAHKKDQVIKITVPATVDEATDVCTVGFKRFSVVGQQKAKELCQWALAFHKQMTQTPMMTPLGGPYPTPSYAESNLFYTSEGRLKTVVKR